MLYKLCLAIVATKAAAQTCSDLKSAYSTSECCSATPNKEVDKAAICNALPATYMGMVDHVISAPPKCMDSSGTCFNRYNPNIPMAMTVTNGSVVRFETSDLWNNPGWDYSTNPDAVANINLAFQDIDVVHILTGPVAVANAMPGDKLAVEILDIKPLGKGFTMCAKGLGFLDDILKTPEDTTWIWWDLHPDGWKSPQLPEVVVPYHPFPGNIAVMPGDTEVDFKLATHVNETAIYGGPGWPVNPNMAIPSSICGVNGTHKERCLKTLAPGVFFGNMDTQRMTIGTTLMVDCFVDGCGLAMGDVHGAQGDGEVSITAIEFPAAVTVKMTVVKPGDPAYATPTPSMSGGSSIKLLAPDEFISFMGLPFKESGFVPSQYRGQDFVDALADKIIIPESMSLAARNALMKCIQFLQQAGGYTFGQALVIASAAADLRVAQVVDKPAVGMECILPLNIFRGAKYAAIYKAAFPFK